MSKKTKTSLGAIALLLLGVAAWAWRGDGVDPAVAALESQRQQVFSGGATDAERQAFRQQVEQLSDEQRRQLFDRGRPDRQRRMAERMTELFSKPPEELRREARQRAEEIIADRAERTEGDRPGGGPPWARGEMTEAQRDAMRKQRLDFVDPSTRAQFSEFRRMIDDDLAAQGQEPMSGRDFRVLMGGGPPRGRG